MPYIEVIKQEGATGRLKEIYDDLILRRGKLADVHMIQSLNPESILAHMDLYMAIMFGQSPLSRSQREMVAVVVSVANGCTYCQVHHAAALNNYWKDNERIERLKLDIKSAGLSKPDELLCDYAIKTTINPSETKYEIILDELKRAGFSDRAILDATLVLAYFNFVNRIVLSLGVEPEEASGEGYKY
jgi:uncharacterized peroxidase-related enzyme